MSSVRPLANRIALLPSSLLATYLRMYFGTPLASEISWALFIDFVTMKCVGIIGDMLHVAFVIQGAMCLVG